jgi:Fe-S-cluster containining protein
MIFNMVADDGSMALEFEDSEVNGLGLECDCNCAYCCLCPPGILEEETASIEKACRDLQKDLGEDRIGDSEVAISSQGEWGACVFLKDKRCKIYESRPHFCRQYPLQVYSGWRLQLSAIRSCRGVVEIGGGLGQGQGPVPLRDILRKEVDVLGESYFKETLEETRQSFEELEEEGAIYDPPATVHERAINIARLVGDARAMSKALGMKVGRRDDAEGKLLDRFWPDIRSTFDSEEIIELPVYCEPGGSWRVFRALENDDISEYTLEASGSLIYHKSLPLEGIGLPELHEGARKVLEDYLSLAFKRDIFYGMVAREGLIEERPMRELALEQAGRIVTDIWWRAGLIGAFKGGKDRPSLGSFDAKEAVIFMDADLLDSYALGAII